MEEKTKNSKKIIGIIVAIVCVALCVVGYFLFVKSDKKENSKDSNTNSNSSSNSNIEDIVYAPTALTGKVKLSKYPKGITSNSNSVSISGCSDETVTLSIENGKVVLVDSKGNKKVDTSIQGEAISIVQARTGCDCIYGSTTAVLTKEGDAYLFVGSPTDENGKITLKFEKVESDKKIVKLAILRIKFSITCADEDLYAYTDETSAYQILSDNGKITLGKSYEEVYPYDDWLNFECIYSESSENSFDVMLTTLGGEVRLASIDYNEKTEDSEYKEQKLMYNGQPLKIKLAYQKEDEEEDTEHKTLYLIGEDNSYYTLSLSIVNDELHYTIVKEAKMVKDINVKKIEKFIYNVTISYTDNTEEKLVEIDESEFISDQKVLESYHGIYE